MNRIKINKNSSIKWTLAAFLTLAVLAGGSSATSYADKKVSALNQKAVSQSLKEKQVNNKIKLIADSSVNYIKYFNYIGLSKDKLLKTLKEKPVKVDEGGLEFKKAGIRVWLEKGKVSQVFTQKGDIDFKGARIGDKIGDFKKALGKPEYDKNSSLWFKYKENRYINVYYDAKTKKTFAVYLLTKAY